MVNFYVDRIKDGKMTLEQVPPKWHDAVESALSVENQSKTNDVEVEETDSGENKEPAETTT